METQFFIINNILKIFRKKKSTNSLSIETETLNIFNHKI